MPRSIITTNQPISKISSSTTLKSTGTNLDRDLLKKRSQKYVRSILELDHGSLTATHGLVELIDKLRNEYGELGILEVPLGIVSKCFLGHPYEVHILDLVNEQIIKHFQVGESLPTELEKARNLAKSGHYAIIEVYPTKMILISADGSATKL